MKSPFLLRVPGTRPDPRCMFPHPSSFQPFCKKHYAVPILCTAY